MGKMFRIGFVTALVATVFGFGGWMVASQWSAKADARPAARPAPRAASKAATPYDRVYKNIYYKVPPGYVAFENGNGVYMVPEDALNAGKIPGALAITGGLELNDPVRAALEGPNKLAMVQALALKAAGDEDNPNPQMTPATQLNVSSNSGYTAYSVLTLTKDRTSGEKRYTQSILMFAGGRVEIVLRVGNGSEENYNKLGVGVDDLLKTVELRTAGAPPPTRLAAALPTDFAAIAPKAKPAQSAGASGQSGGGGNCHIVQRRSCSGGFASGMGYFCNTYPQRVCN